MTDERVSDPLDRAAQLEEAERVAATRLRRPVPQRNGRCAACDEPLLDPTAYVCDASCREEAERQASTAWRNGRR